jgi:type I restriction enzyme S subunit
VSWESWRLDELGKVSRGRSRHRPRNAPHLYGGPYPFIQTGDVKHASLYVTEHSQTYSEAGLEQSKLWPPGTLCITIAANIADTAILSYEACFPDSVIGFIPDPKKADARFIKYYFDAALRSKYKQFSQGVAQDNLSQEKLLSLNLVIPDVDVQKEIAEKIAIFDNLIENNRRRIVLLEESARLLYREWFVYLRFPGHEHVKVVDGVPEAWERRPLGDLLTLQRGFDLPSAERIEGEFPIYAATGINGYHNKAMVTGPGVITGRSGSLGTVLYSPKEFWPLNTTLWVKEFKRVSPEFALFLLSSLNLEQYNGGVAVPTLNRNDVHRIEVSLPPKTLLDEFTDVVRVQLQQVENLTQYNNKLREARDLLLPRLMNGDIQV